MMKYTIPSVVFEPMSVPVPKLLHAKMTSWRNDFMLKPPHARMTACNTTLLPGNYGFMLQSLCCQDVNEVLGDLPL